MATMRLVSRVPIPVGIHDWCPPWVPMCELLGLPLCGFCRWRAESRGPDLIFNLVTPVFVPLPRPANLRRPRRCSWCSSADHTDRYDKNEVPVCPGRRKWREDNPDSEYPFLTRRLAEWPPGA